MCKKYPAGTKERWERIAVALGRSVDDVTKKAKSLKTGELKVNEALLEGHRQQSVVQTSDITVRDDLSAAASPTSVTSWSQEEQAAFESALQSFPKGTLDR